MKRAPHWHDDLNVEWIGPSISDDLLRFRSEPPPLECGPGEDATAAPRSHHVKHEAYRDGFRVVVRAMYEVELLRRQRLFAIVNRRTGERLDPLTAGVNWWNYYPLGRPSLPELLSAYAFNLRLDADQVLAP